MIIDCISDLHGHYPKLEGGDLLIVAGDLTARDTIVQHAYFADWLSKQKYTKKIVIAGNHDVTLFNGTLYSIGYSFKTIDGEGIKFDYLCDSGTEFEGLKIWGSPWTKTFPGMNPKCKAFTVDTEEELQEKWDLIPNDTDILITHCPPWGILDKNIYGDNCGSKTLIKWVANHVKTLKLFVFGHIHESFGIYDIRSIQKEISDPITPIFINASHVNEHYNPVNKPIRVIL